MGRTGTHVTTERNKMASNATKNEVNIPQLFGEVSKFFRDGEYALAQKSANKILKEIPNDVDAIKCKSVCLIQQSCFQEALDVIVSTEKKGLLQMPFEKAYCLYRLNRLNESAAILNTIEEPSLQEKELLAQVKYRLDDYGSCLELYKDLIKNSADDYGDEREANMAAVVAAAKMWKNETIGSSNVRNDTHELCYNYGCLLLAQGDLTKAECVLQEAENLCKKNLEADEDYTEEEIEDELVPMRSQIGYIKQLQGKTTEALAVYNQVLKAKPSEIAFVAVISNNIIAIHKEKDLFDSKKRLKAMSVDSLQHKLTQPQLQTIEINKCLLYMYTNQLANCRKCIKNLQANFLGKETDKAAILEAAFFLKDKHTDQAIEHLDSILNSGVESNDLGLTLAQLYMTKGKYEKALDVLKGLKSICYTPAIVSLCISLFNVLGKEVEAMTYLDEAIKYGQQNPGIVKKEHVIAFMKESSNLKLAGGDVESAVKMLEVLRNEDPSEIMTVAKIVAAYSKIDLKKAQEYSVHLPPLAKVTDKEIDLNMLEMTDMIGSFRFSKKTLKQSLEEGDSKEEVIRKKKSRKRKKGKLPKNYNPDIDPDPERWLPRWERSTFKHKKAKRGTNAVGKGTQGSVPTDQPQSPKPASASSPKSGVTNANATPNSPSTTSNVVPPRQQKPGAKAKSKKKKKGGW